MRIIYLHQYFFTPSMPGGTRSYEMARRLIAKGHQVVMVTSLQNPDGNSIKTYSTEEEGITVYWIPVPYDNNMGFAKRLKAFLTFSVKATKLSLSLKGDLIFATSTPLTIAIPAIISSKVNRIPYVFEVRDVWPAVPIALGKLKNPILCWLARQLEKVAYKQADHVVALAPGMGEEVEKSDIAVDKITIIPNGCDNDIFALQADDQNVRAVRKDPWLAENPLVLFAGTLGVANGVDYIVKIAVEMKKFNPGIRFLIIGNGAAAACIAEEAKKSDVLDQNLRIMNAIPKVELANFLNAADCCLALFSGPRILWKDAVQNKFFDALSAGKPVVSNHNGWQAQIAKKHDVGFTIPHDDPQASAKALSDALSDESWLEGVKERAQGLATTRFNRENLAAQLEAVLSNVHVEHQKKSKTKSSFAK